MSERTAGILQYKQTPADGTIPGWGFEMFLHATKGRLAGARTI